MHDDIRGRLARLRDPAPPSTLAATVMARVAREADRRREGAPVPAAGRFADWRMPLRVFAGLAIVLVVTVAGWLSTGLPPDLTSPRVGIGSPALLPSGAAAVAMLFVGVVLYLTGLFAPLRRTRGR